MEAFQEKKGNTIQSLLNVTSALLNEVDSGDIEQLESGLSERSRLFSVLEKLDKNSNSKPTSEDEKWMQQLESLKQMGATLKSRLEEHLQNVGKALCLEKEAKLNLLRAEMADTKGANFSTKA